MAVICPSCKRKFTTPEFLKRHGEVMHKDEPPAALKRKGWATPYGFVDMKEPCTYEEAVEVSKTLHDAFTQRQK